jgi:hypothetical protein
MRKQNTTVCAILRGKKLGSARRASTKYAEAALPPPHVLPPSQAAEPDSDAK